MNNRLAEEKLNKLLPALSLLAEDLGEKTMLDPVSLRAILLSADVDHEEWAQEELQLWLQSLDKAKKNPTKTQKDAAIEELKNRGIPEFPAMLAIYVATNQPTENPQPSASAISLPFCSKAESTDKPAEPYHILLPDHGWHNDLTWEQLPNWIKRDPSLMARLKRGEQVIGKNVRYRFVANKLIRRLRYRTPVASSTVHLQPAPASNTSFPRSTVIDNTALLRDLIIKKLIRLRDSQILSHTPSPLPPSFVYDKVEGMLLGIAIGDALGVTSEGCIPRDRRKLYGEVRDYQTDRRSRHNHTKGVGSDDTQMSFWTIEQLIDDGGLRPDSLARKFCKDRIWGIGGTTKKFVENFKDRNLPWYQAGSESLGNGALMRIAPVILPYLRNPNPSMYADAAIDTMITHNDFANNASSVAFVHILWELLRMSSPPEPSWWIDTYCSIVKELEGNTSYQHSIQRFGNYSGPLWHFTNRVCKDALKKGLTAEEACSSWRSKESIASIFETIPSVLYILATHAGNFEEAIIRAVNDTRDNDTVASIVGAAVGAIHGLEGIPERWLKHLKGTIREDGESQVFRLLTQSKQVFWLQNQP